MFDKALVVSTLVINVVISLEENTKNLTIEELEKQKNELYKQINVAIDESVKSLLRVNDTEATLGLNYMRDLKEHIKNLNGTENSSEVIIDVDSKSDLENRRSLQKGLEYFKKTSRPKDDPFDFEAVLKPKRITEKEWKEMIENRQKMQQKLDLWISEREKEKERIKMYKMEKKRLLMSGKYEKCPRFGYHGKKKKEKKRGRSRIRPCRIELNITSGKEYANCPIPSVIEVTTEGGKRKKRKQKDSEKNKYPCCRKCCKKSYMGCL